MLGLCGEECLAEPWRLLYVGDKIPTSTKAYVGNSGLVAVAPFLSRTAVFFYLIDVVYMIVDGVSTPARPLDFIAGSTIVYLEHRETAFESCLAL